MRVRVGSINYRPETWEFHGKSIEVSVIHARILGLKFLRGGKKTMLQDRRVWSDKIGLQIPSFAEL